jgi:shikimate kinase
MIISLTGFMGCGKSSVGRRLSELLCCPFMDLDAVIEERSGRSIPEIFANDGETAFRDIERDVLTDVLSATMAVSSRGPLILSLGGGTVMTPECEAMIHEKTLCIYLRTSVETLVSRLSSEVEGRPMLNAGRTQHDVIPSEAEESISQVEALCARIESLMARRASTYERTAHIIIDTDSHTIDSLAEELSKIIQK